MPNDLPDAFDEAFYKASYADVAGMTSEKAREHYLRFGISEGRLGSIIQLREHFLTLISCEQSTLEVGPFTTPSVRGENVSYFDVASKSEMIVRAAALGHPVDNAPEIEFVSPTADMRIVDRKFAQVFSSHCIEHQPDFVGHLNDVSLILDAGSSGRLYLIVPDKRFCFDHFIEASNLADILGAHVDGRRLHTSTAIIRSLCMTTHNDPLRHWAGDHGVPAVVQNPSLLNMAYGHAINSRQAYTEAHAWQFTPDSFSGIVSALNSIGLIDLEVERLYHTPINRFEFMAVLRKRLVS